MSKKVFKNICLIAFLAAFCLISIFSYSKNDHSKSIYHRSLTNESCSKKYIVNCLKLFAKLSLSYATEINEEPPQRIPDELFDEFTQQGAMPIRDYLFINEAVPWNENKDIKEIMMKTIEKKWENDADKNVIIRDELKKRAITNEWQAKNQEDKEFELISKRVLDEWRMRVRNAQPLNYGNSQLQKLMFEYASEFKNKKVVIYGNQFVWIEAILLELEVGKITVLNNRKFQYEQNELLEGVSFKDFVENSLKENKIDQFDHAISFSFIQHLGLGRFGETLDPNADLDAVHHLSCMLKQSGLLFLGIPVTQVEKGFIDFNTQRFYGSKRLDLLFKGWKKIGESKLDGVHVVFVLRKESLCE